MVNFLASTNLEKRMGFNLVNVRQVCITKHFKILSTLASRFIEKNPTGGEKA